MVIKTSDIADKAITYDKLSDEVRSMSSGYDKSNIYTYIDCINGNDSTAKINDVKNPFKTLDAALEKTDIVSNNFRFYFLNGGTYTLTARIFYGCVIHFFTDKVKSNVIINVENDYGNLFLYDTHVNFGGTSDHPLIINLKSDGDASTTKGQIEAEGSTLWCAYTIFNVKRIYAIQGSSYFNNCTINGSIRTFFSSVRGKHLIINNKISESAIYMHTSNLRCEVDNGLALQISDNKNYTEGNAIQLYSTQASFPDACFSEGKVKTAYNRFLEARSSSIHCSSKLFESFHGYAKNLSSINLYSTLVSTTSNFKLEGLTEAITVSGNSYVDYKIDLPLTLPAAPYVQITPRYCGTNSKFGSVSVSYHSQTVKSFTIRIYNNSDTKFNLKCCWVAYL